MIIMVEYSSSDSDSGDSKRSMDSHNRKGSAKESNDEYISSEDSDDDDNEGDDAAMADDTGMENNHGGRRRRGRVSGSADGREDEARGEGRMCRGGGGAHQREGPEFWDGNSKAWKDETRF